MVCYRRAPNLLPKRRRFASKQGDEFGTYRCGSVRCRACALMSQTNTFKSTVTRQDFSAYIRTCCSTRCTVCSICAKQYVGNTVALVLALFRLLGAEQMVSVEIILTLELKAHAIAHRDVFANSFNFHFRCCPINFWRKKPSGFTDLGRLSPQG